MYTPMEDPEIDSLIDYDELLAIQEEYNEAIYKAKDELDAYYMLVNSPKYIYKPIKKKSKFSNLGFDPFNLRR